MIYPEKVASLIATSNHNRKLESSSATAADARMDCGCVVRFWMEFDERDGRLSDCTYQSNGCGFMLATAELLARDVIDSPISKLHGLSDTELVSKIDPILDAFPSDRMRCREACFNALRATFKDLRERRIEEFVGEKALVCTCFGVTEAVLDSLIEGGAAASVEDVSAQTNAGTGCGSCRIVIEEILAAHGVGHRML